MGLQPRLHGATASLSASLSAHPPHLRATRLPRLLGLDFHLRREIGPPGARPGLPRRHRGQRLRERLLRLGVGCRGIADFGRASRPHRSLPLGPGRLSGACRVCIAASGAWRVQPQEARAVARPERVTRPGTWRVAGEPTTGGQGQWAVAPPGGHFGPMLPSQRRAARLEPLPLATPPTPLRQRLLLRLPLLCQKSELVGR